MLALAAAGQAVPAVLVAELGRAVLGSEAVTLAQRALEPGPFQLRAGIELARRVLVPASSDPTSLDTAPSGIRKCADGTGSDRAAQPAL